MGTASLDLKTGKITFRHPLARDENGYGRIQRRGVAKLPTGMQGQVVEYLEQLLEAKPVTLDKAPELPDNAAAKLALKFYFDPLTAPEEILKPPDDATEDRLLARDHAIERAIERGVPALFDELAAERGKLNRALARIAELEGENLVMRKQMGTRGAAEQAITLRKCLAHFEQHTRCRSTEARRPLLYRVKLVVGKLGLDKRHATITRGMIEQAVKDSGPKSDAEKLYRTSFIKRFFRELSWPTESDGLGLSNPAASLTVGSVSAVQRKRRESNGGIEILDPAPLLKLRKLSPYWKALVAVIGYGGLRPAEAAALEWPSIDEKAGIIRIRPTEAYPQLKSVMSARDVKPFGNVWQYIKAHKAKARNVRIVFDRPGSKTRTWFFTPDDKPRQELTKAFRKALRRAGVKNVKEPGRRLRRFWETSMRAKGLGNLIEAMGGHANAVGLAHYTRNETVVEAAEVGKL